MAKEKVEDIQKNIVKLDDDSKNVKSLVTKAKMDAYNKEYDHSDKFLSNELLTIANRISSSRCNMYEQQMPQALMVLNPEVPAVYTGYEHEVGKYSKSYYQSDRAWKVVHKISRYTNHPDLQYYLVVVDQNGMYDVISRKPGEHLTESYGFANVNGDIDSKAPGSMISPGEILFKSTAFDDNMNYRYGINARTVYISCPQVTEDAIWASDELCNKLQYCTMSTIEVSYSTNELLTNYYGNDSVYKSFPDIGEDTRLKVLCAKRKLTNRSMLHNLRDSNLRNIVQDEDDVFYAKGKVVGIDVFCNKQEADLVRNPATAQIMYYYDEQKRFYKEIKSKLGKIVTNNPGKVSDRLLHIYHRADDMSGNKTILNGNNKFDNIILVFTVMNVKHAGKGSKISGRFGEKGVIGTISPKEDMPKNKYGENADLVLSPQGVFGRLNIGQWSEQELTFLADNVVRDLKIHQIPAAIGMPKILEFANDVNPQQATGMNQYWLACNPQEKELFYMDIMANGLKIHQPPFWDNVGFTELRRLYQKYKYPRYKMTYKGEPIIRRLIMGKKYIMLLKQTPESKYSARSLGMQSSLGHPSKSIKFKKHNLPYSNTPIRIGEMELMNLCMMNDPKAVADFLSIYANSQQNREGFVREILTTNNPFNIQYRCESSQSINRKMMNAYCKASGCMLVD